MKKMKKILATMLALVCVLTAFPTMEAKAGTDILEGGYETKETAFPWGAYMTTKTIIVDLPVGEKDFWVKFTLPKGSHVYVRCSYNSDNEGMYVETLNSSGRILDKKVSPQNVLDMDTSSPFMGLVCDNTETSLETIYIHANRGNNTGKLHFSLSVKERIKTGKETFPFIGTATNPGNSSVSLSGVNSSVLTLDLTNNSAIPNKAIVTSVRTSSTQTPSQGNVHHMILPDTQSAKWFTAKTSSATRGSYDISSTDNFKAAQVWKFKYNALATAKSTMKNVTLTLEWEYDLQYTDYQSY